MKSRRAFITGPISKFKNVFQDNNLDADIEQLNKHSLSEFDTDECSNIDSLYSDFTLMDLQMEIMSLGKDPANMSREQMLEIVYDEMEIQKKENHQKLNTNKNNI